MKPWENSKQQYYELRQGAALQREHLPYVSEEPPLKGVNMCFNTPNPGLTPWAMQEYRPKGLILVLVILRKRVQCTRFRKYA